MELDYFTNLPSEITTYILSRLSIRSLAISESVCKAWRDLFDFVKSKIKTPPALIRIYRGRNSTPCKIIEIEDEDEVDLESHDLHYHPLTDLEIPYGSTRSFEGVTANGLLLLYSLYTKGIPLYICNLITCEYTELNYPELVNIPNKEWKFGFGVSKISGQYKVVCINEDTGSDSHCVYTLGTGTWRRVKAGAASGFNFWGVPILCNDNLHWSVYDLRNHIRVVCGFDFETERFSTFSLPPIGIRNGKLSVLRDCLCYSYYTHINGEIVIWTMMEYQVDESWTIEYKMSTNGLDLSSRTDYIYVEAIKVFKDSDVLMLLDRSILVYYSNNTRTVQQVDMLKDANVKRGYAFIFNPSLLSLNSFGFENVISF